MSKDSIRDALRLTPHIERQIHGFTAASATKIYGGRIRRELRDLGYPDRPVRVTDAGSLGVIDGHAGRIATSVVKTFNAMLDTQLAALPDEATDDEINAALAPFRAGVAKHNRDVLIPYTSDWARQQAVNDFYAHNGIGAMWTYDPPFTTSPDEEECAQAIALGEATFDDFDAIASGSESGTAAYPPNHRNCPHALVPTRPDDETLPDDADLWTAGNGHKRLAFRATTYVPHTWLGRAYHAPTDALPAVTNAMAALRTEMAKLIAVLDYNPDEPRDEDGKWTDEGGTSGGGGAATAEEAAHEPPAPSAGHLVDESPEANTRRVDDYMENVYETAGTIDKPTGPLARATEARAAQDVSAADIAARSGGAITGVEAKTIMFDWGLSSSRPNAVLVEAAQEKRLGMAMPANRMQALANARESLGSDFDAESKKADAFVAAQYDRTQALLNAKRITDVPLVRGLVFDAPDAAHPEGLGAMPDALNVPDDGLWHPVTISQNALSSWTGDTETAKNFAPQGDRNTVGVELAATVPARKIFSTAYTGMGEAYENEYLVTGGPMDVLVRRSH